MKQRFLNQKLGKRMSRKAALDKAKLFSREPRAGKAPAWRRAPEAGGKESR